MKMKKSNMCRVAPIAAALIIAVSGCASSPRQTPDAPPRDTIPARPAQLPTDTTVARPGQTPRDTIARPGQPRRDTMVFRGDVDLRISDSTRPEIDPRTPPAPPRVGPPRPPAPPIRNMVVAILDSVRIPESALFDSTNKVWYVTNMVGGSLEKDQRAFISRFTMDTARQMGAPRADSNARTGSRGVELRWIESGRNSVTLNSPKGMALSGDTLWVADIDMVRLFNVRTGAPIRSIDFSTVGAVFLNDVAVGPDGMIYVTDTDMRSGERGLLNRAGAGRVYRIKDGMQPEVALTHDKLANPNGITWDASGSRFIIAPMGGDSLLAWKPGTDAPETLAAGPGLYDGVVVHNGRIFVASQASGSVHELIDGELVKVITNVPSVGDIGLDPVMQVIGVPMLNHGKVVFVKIPDTGK